MCPLSLFAQVRQCGLGEQEGAADVDVHHQVVALHRHVLGLGQVDGRGVVDHHVDAAEALVRLGDGGGHVLVVAHVPHDGQRIARRRRRSPRAAVNTVPARFAWAVAVLAMMATLAPSAAARSAMASPMPRTASAHEDGLALQGPGIGGDRARGSIHSCEPHYVKPARAKLLVSNLFYGRLGPQHDTIL